MFARLSDLANGGNVAAQVMLGSLVAGRRVPASVGDLPRAERIALTRALGGLSGTSWLTVAADSDPVAAAQEVARVPWQQSNPEDQVAVLQTLLTAGEAGAALQLLTFFALQGGWGPGGGWTNVLEHAGHPALQGHGVPLLVIVLDMATSIEVGIGNPEAAARASVALAGANQGDVGLAQAAMRQAMIDGSGSRLMPAGALALVARAPLAAPLVQGCARACPQTASRCALSLTFSVSGRPGVLTLSPFERLVSSAEYQASPRFVGDLRSTVSAAGLQMTTLNACVAAPKGG